MRLKWGLIGRAEEVKLVEATLADPEMTGIVIRGSAGVGKSRLAREALAHAAAHGWQERWLVGTAAAQSIPLGAASDWVGPPGSATLDVVRMVIDNMTAAPAGGPVVIGVDDVAMLDDLTTFAMQQIVRRRLAKVVLTLRDDDSDHGAAQEIWTHGQFEHHVLQPLSREDSSALVANALGGRLDHDAANRLWRLTQGNVLYLRTIVECEVAAGRLAPHGEIWMWSGAPIMPPSLVELIERRVGALPEAVSDVIDVLAVAEPLHLTDLTSITSPAAVEEADVRGLISVETSERGVEVRVAHPLYGEVRRERAAQTRLRRLRGLIAQQLAATERNADVHGVVRRATLAVDSELTPDAQLLTTAAQGAVSLADMPLADRLAEAAIRAGAGAEAYFIRAWALVWARPAEAEAVLADIPVVSLTDEEHAQRAGYRFACLLWGLADPEGAKRVLDETPDPGRLNAQYIMHWAAMAQPAAAIALAPNVILDELPPLAASATSWALGVAYGDSGRLSDALATFENGYSIVSKTGQGAHLRHLIGDRHLGVLLQCGRICEAETLASQLLSEAEDLLGGAQLLSVAISGRAALGAGRAREAHALLEPVVDSFFAAGDVNGLGYRYQICDTVALAMLGATGQAAIALAHLDERRYRSYGFVRYEHELARAWVAASRGMMSAAIDTCLAAAECTRANGQVAAEVICLQTATQFGSRSCTARLHELASLVEGPRVCLAARMAAGLSDGDAAELGRTSEEFERIGDLVAAVDAAAHAAVTFRRQDRRGSALVWSTRAETLADLCGLATPALQLAGMQVPLTDREREIVSLLGENLSTPAIAERLTLSRRTVENHIYRAMVKTGVASRAELAALLPGRQECHRGPVQ